ncbi:MAG: cyclopropane-fatty-acyl-phospholipid synthase family protein, partial [Opitutales bacterium]
MKTEVKTVDRGAPPFPQPATVAERLVLSSLRAMRTGRLYLELPDGRTCFFGRTPEDPRVGKEEAPGNEPQVVIRIRQTGFFRRCLLYGDIGFAESYMAGEWETDDLTMVIRWFLANLEQAPAVSGSRRGRAGLNVLRLVNRLSHLARPNSLSTSRRNISEHYDLSNAFFSTFLDKGMTYSSALWTRPDLTLEEAQQAKHDRLCHQLRLKAGDRILELGCGWGSFAVYAARNYECRVTALTLSKEQYTHAFKAVGEAGMRSLVEIRLEDYRDHRGCYDKIASIEMLEAVGHRYLPKFARACHRFLVPTGLMALQFIVYPDSRYAELRRNVDFIQKHIFPGSLLLSQNRLNSLLAAEGGFWLHDR